jgi:hypothetical protein
MFALFAPSIRLAGENREVVNGNLVANVYYASLTFVYLGWGAVYQSAHISYYVGSYSLNSVSTQHDYIETRSLSLCFAKCNYPAPYVSAEIFVNGTSPLTSLRLFINETNQGAQNYTHLCCLRNFVIDFGSGVKNQTIPIIAGKNYLVKFVATFQDNQTSVSVSPITRIGSWDL